MWKGNLVESVGNNKYRVRTRPSVRYDNARDFIVEEDKHYVIIPCNKNVLKNRNRECVFLSGHGTLATVRFIDTGRKGKVSFDDLAEIIERDRTAHSLRLLNEKKSISKTEHSQGECDDVN